MIFDDIMTEIQAIHELRPGMKLGHILQLSIDEHRNKRNLDLTQVSNKVLLSGLIKFKKKIMNKDNVGEQQ